MEKEKHLFNDIVSIAYKLKCIHDELHEISEEIEYRDKGEKEYAGDDLKDICGNLMDEIQKIYPVYY